MAAPEQTQYLFECWAAHYGAAHAQIASFDFFLNTKLQEIISEGSSLRVENERRGIIHNIEFGKVSIRSPAMREIDGAYHSLTPQECRLRGLSYNCGVYVDVEHCITGPEEESRRVYVETLLCKLPCLIRSAGCTLSSCPLTVPRSQECPLDPGAYFIVNGSEKARRDHPFLSLFSPPLLDPRPLGPLAPWSGPDRVCVCVEGLHRPREAAVKLRVCQAYGAEVLFGGDPVSPCSQDAKHIDAEYPAGAEDVASGGVVPCGSALRGHAGAFGGHLQAPWRGWHPAHRGICP
jgi:hypothetical protein